MSPNTRLLVALAMPALFIFGAGPRMAAAQQTDSPQKPPTFSKEIVRIFQDRCQSCHHSGAPFAPMSLVKYTEVRPWAKAIHKKVVSREMPPWHADSSGRELANDPSLSKKELVTIVRWVEAGAPQGDPADLPPAKNFERRWQIDGPDVVLDMGVDFDVPASGPLPIQYFRIDTDFGEDKWLSALEARPGDPSVVRQIVVYVQNPKEGASVLDGGTLGNGLLGVYSRGYTQSIFKEGEGKLIKRGAKIIFQVLYSPKGTKVTDRSYIGLNFHRKPVRKHVITRAISETGFEVPPHVPDFRIYAIHEFSEDVTLLSMRPLMHYRGEQFVYIAHYADGRNEVLLFVDRYDYDWQTVYYPKEPIRLPAGTVLECRALMNNSHDNPKNPEPHAALRSGDQPLEEKMIGWIDYTLDSEDLTLQETDL